MTNLSVAAPAAAGEFRIGRVFDRTITLLSRNFPTFLAVTAVAALPQLLVERGDIGVVSGMPVQSGRTALAGFLSFFLGALSQAVILHAAFQDMRGRPVNLGESLRMGLRRFLAIIGVLILFSLGVGIGFALLLIPGFILITMWFVGIPVCVVEGLGPVRSLKRSSQLTKGHRWKIFGIVVLVMVVVVVVQAVLTKLLFAFGGSLAVTIAQFIWQAVWGALYSIFVVVTYHDLRVAKEGIDIHQIASVFD